MIVIKVALLRVVVIDSLMHIPRSMIKGTARYFEVARTCEKDPGYSGGMLKLLRL